jgi:hypothetical protein
LDNAPSPTAFTTRLSNINATKDVLLVKLDSLAVLLSVQPPLTPLQQLKDEMDRAQEFEGFYASMNASIQAYKAAADAIYTSPV